MVYYTALGCRFAVKPRLKKRLKKGFSSVLNEFTALVLGGHPSTSDPKLLYENHKKQPETCRLQRLKLDPIPIPSPEILTPIKPQPLSPDPKTLNPEILSPINPKTPKSQA